MKIIYLSDFNCPYSYIGLKRITDVCKELDLDVEWEMKAFELEPNARNLSTVDRTAIKFDLSVEDALKEIKKIDEIAQNDNLNINYKEMIINSSKDAHRLVKYVQDRYPEISQELVLKIFEANFIKHENIANHEVLLKITTSCRLDKSEINEFLKSNSLSIEVDLDIDEAVTNGITTIPYYFVEFQSGRLIIPGVFEKEDFKVAFKDLISGEIENKTFI